MAQFFTKLKSKEAEAIKLNARTSLTDFEYLAEGTADTDIIQLQSGKEYRFGTVTGKAGSTDTDTAMTFQLPVPFGAGEKIRVEFTNAAVVAKILGISSADPANVNISYSVYESGDHIESADTTAGVDGTANTMVKLAASHYKIGDYLDCVSTSATNWLVKIQAYGGLIAAGDIAPDPGNANGYID